MMLRVSGNEVFRKIGRGCAAGLGAAARAVWNVLCFLPRSLVRLFSVDLQQLSVTAPESERLRRGAERDAAVMQYLVWRRALLFWVFVLTAANLGWQIHQSWEIFHTVDLEGIWSTWGYVSEIIRLVAVATLPLAALLGFVLWRRLRFGSSLLILGFLVATLVPIFLVAVPTHLHLDWDSMGADIKKSLEEFQKNLDQNLDQMEVPADERPQLFQGPWKGLPVVHGVFDVIGALYYLALLAPSLCAMFPGILRACLRVKTLVPEATTPGWCTLTVVPLYLIYLLILFATMSTVYRFPELVASLSLFIIAPMLHLINVRSMLRPWRVPTRRKSAYALGWLASFLYVTALILMINFFARKEIPFEGKTYYILSWIPDNRLLLGYEDVAFWIADYFGRTLLITLVVSDLLLRATIALWRHGSALASAPDQPVNDRLSGFEREMTKTNRRISASVPPQ
jgi:hypothetical protein